MNYISINKRQLVASLTKPISVEDFLKWYESAKQDKLDKVYKIFEEYGFTIDDDLYTSYNDLPSKMKLQITNITEKRM